MHQVLSKGTRSDPQDLIQVPCIQYEWKVSEREREPYKGCKILCSLEAKKRLNDRACMQRNRNFRFDLVESQTLVDRLLSVVEWKERIIVDIFQKHKNKKPFICMYH